MVFIHKNTFDVIRTDLSRIMQSNDYFAVDELIAPTIQILNRKGYITEFSCSGHPFPYITEGYMNHDPERKIFETRDEYSAATYISFKEGIFLPHLPPGFVVDDGDDSQAKLVITKKYRNFNKDFFEKARNILESMEELYKWALDLPEFQSLNLNFL